MIRKQGVTIKNKMKTKFYAIKGFIINPGETVTTELSPAQLKMYKNYSRLIDIQLISELEKESEKESEEIYECESCGKKYEKRQSYLKHIKKCGKETDESKEEEKENKQEQADE